MVTVIQEQNPWASIAERGVDNAIKGVTERSDEMALKKSLESLGDDADPRDVLKAIVGTKTYNNEAKQEALKNYIGIEQFNSVKKKAENEEQRLKQQQVKNEARELEKVEDKKKANEINDRRLNEQIRHNEALEKQSQTKNELLANKTPPMSYKDKLRTQEYVKEEIALEKQIPILEDSQRNFDEIRKLSKSLGFTGAISQYLSSTGKKLEGLSYTALEPVIKIFNPAGPLAQKKLEVLKDMYHIKASDLPWVKEGKLQALEALGNQALGRAKDRMEFLRKWNSTPSQEAEEQFNKESELLLDTMVDHGFVGKIINQEGLPDPKKLNGRTMTNADGTKIYSDGKQWIQK